MLHEYERAKNITADSLIKNSTSGNPFEAMHMYKDIIRQVARKARDTILALQDMPETRDCLLNTCSRAVLANDVCRAKYLYNKYPIARESLVFRNNSVSLRSFEDVFRAKLNGLGMGLFRLKFNTPRLFHVIFPNALPRSAKSKAE